MEIHVTKKSGTLEPFQREKIIKSCLGAGAQQAVAERVADEVAKSVREGMPTSEIQAAVLSNLSKEDPALVMKFMEYTQKKKQ